MTIGCGVTKTITQVTLTLTMSGEEAELIKVMAGKNLSVAKLVFPICGTNRETTLGSLLFQIYNKLDIL